MKVALVYPDLAHKGGAESVIVWTACGLLRRGHQVSVITAAAAPQLWPDFPEFARCVELVETVPARRRRQRSLRTGKRIAARLREFPLVVAHNRDGLLWAHGRASGRPGSPALAWYCHEPPRNLYAAATESWLVGALQRDDVDARHPALLDLRRFLDKTEATAWRRHRTRRKRRFERRYARLPGHVLVNSAYTAATLEAALGCRASVVHPGLPPRGPLPPATGAPEGIAVISGRGPKKNLMGVLAVAAELEARGTLPGTQFHVWGVGTDGPEFREAVQRMGLRARVQLHGFLSDEAAAARLRSARLCLFLPFCEPFGLVAVEALQAGVPVLASDHAGPAEILEICGGGDTVDPMRPELVADALVGMLAEPAAEARWRAAARAAGETADRAFSLDRHLDALEALDPSRTQAPEIP
ncbi:MAG TPA: glycosyltransferase family 4 protein [Planctomycetota bacterium]